jgi:predicted aspartyl protease
MKAGASLGSRAKDNVVRISSISERDLDGAHLIVECSLFYNKKEILTHSLIDSGASGFAFIDEKFARQHNLPMYSLKVPRALSVIDGREISSGDITHLVKLPMKIGKHREEISAFVTSLGQYPLVLGIPWLQKHNVKINFKENELIFDSLECLHWKHMTRVTKVPGIKRPKSKTTDICGISLHAMTRLARNEKNRYGEVKMFQASMYDLDRALDKIKVQEEGWQALVPDEYHDFLPLFEKVVADKLPPHRAYDHTIPLKEGFTPPFGPLYSMSRPELETLRDWLHENLAKGFIRASSSPAGAPVLFAKKSGGGLRFCVAYRVMNENTIKNRYPSVDKETLMNLSKAKWFTKLDVRGAYNLIRIKEGEEWKTAFRTRYGLYECAVMPFGLTNAPASFQHLLMMRLQPFLDSRFVSAYWMTL